VKFKNYSDTVYLQLFEALLTFAAKKKKPIKNQSVSVRKRVTSLDMGKTIGRDMLLAPSRPDLLLGPT
jgi:hypothetical protein